MNLMHEAMLSDFIQNICDTGVGRIEKRVLLRWFGQERMSVGIRRDLQQRFEAALDEEGNDFEKWSLLMVDPDDGHFAFAAVDLDDTKNGEGWWEDVSKENRSVVNTEPA
jgi:hypothetical protein